MEQLLAIAARLFHPLVQQASHAGFFLGVFHIARQIFEFAWIVDQVVELRRAARVRPQHNGLQRLRSDPVPRGAGDLRQP